MDGPHRRGPKRWQPSRRYLVAALAIVALALGWGVMSSLAPGGADPVAARAPVPAPPPAAEAPVLAAVAPGTSAVAAPPRAVPASAASQQISRLRDPSGDQTPDIADYVNAGEKPTVREVIDRLHQAGVRGGIGAFSPPGTRPPLVGLAVPENFALPPGYVRHHQATDDGQRIEPILMFSPDHQLFDARGQPIAMPNDRVVPPELAPPGLPIRRITIPAPTDPGRPGS